MVFPSCGSSLRNTLQVSHFRSKALAQVYETILSLDDRGVPIDVTAVFDAADASGLRLAADYARLSEILDHSSVPAGAAHHAKRLTERNKMIEIRAVARSILEMTEAGKTTGEICESTYESLASLQGNGNGDGGMVPAREAVDRVMAALESRMDGQPWSGISTGFRSLDEMTAGFHDGDLIVLAGRPSMGKTSLALSFARSAAINQHKSVAFLSLEMSSESLVSRLLAMISGVPFSRVRSGKLPDDELAKVTDASATISISPLQLMQSQSGLTQLRAELRRVRASSSLDMACIDYLTLMDPPPGKENRQQEVAALSRGLKQMAMELKIPIIVLSQLKRALQGQEAKEPILSDLRESGAVEQDSDLVLFVHRKSLEEPLGELILGKQRNGPIGRIPMRFEKELVRFVESPRLTFYP